MAKSWQRNFPKKVGEKTEQEIKQMINIVSSTLQLNVDDVINKKEYRPYVDARYIIVERIRSKFESGVPYRYISSLFNRKSHTFAFQAELFCKEWVQTNKDFRKKYEMVVNVLDKNVNIA